MFESYVPSTAFDLLFTSGVLYLYNDEMVTSFMAKARSMLVTRGLLILRDFVAQPAEIRKSAYVDDGYCYYRSPKFWKEQALQHEFMTEHIGLSKPKIGLVRKPCSESSASIVPLKITQASHTYQSDCAFWLVADAQQSS